MYVSINMDDLQFVHKHAEHETCSALAWLEMPNKSVVIEKTEREYFLHKMTGLDLRMLYRNTTGLDVTGTEHLVMREMLATLVNEKLKATFASYTEVEAQILAVNDDLEKGIPWKYALGARKPAKQEELFPLTCSPLTADEATAAAVRAPQHRQAVIATPRAAATEQRPIQPQRAAPRASNIRPVIWATADAMWEEAGKPKDKAVVLELRKKMMAHLEAEKGIKRTSSSNELGNWMKDRLELN